MIVRTSHTLRAAAVGALTGWLSSWLLAEFDGEFAVDYVPGVLFGIGVVAYRAVEMRPLSRDSYIIAFAFVAGSAISFRLAVEVAIRLSGRIGTSEPLWIPGIAAGLIGSLQLVAVWQLTKLGRRSKLQWVMVVLAGSLLGLLLEPAMNTVMSDLPENPRDDPRFGILFIPWQAGVAAALLGFGPPQLRPRDF
ncbi:MAG: hypothetical protein AAGH89_13505 [Verrucomicrobiota bacterium]